MVVCTNDMGGQVSLIVALCKCSEVMSVNCQYILICHPITSLIMQVNVTLTELAGSMTPPIYVTTNQKTTPKVQVPMVLIIMCQNKEQLPNRTEIGD
jgi:hypothetical protein